MLSVSPLSRAEIVWNTLGSGSFGVSFRVGLLDECNRQWAIAFRSLTDCELTAIEAPLSIVAKPSEISLILAGDADGAPGESIETFVIANITNTEPAMHAIHPAQPIRLKGNTQYWIVARAASPAQMVWSNTTHNSSANGRIVAFRDNDERWSVGGSPYIPGIVIMAKPLKGPDTARAFRARDLQDRVAGGERAYL
jgi:hypothetical protein